MVKKPFRGNYLTFEVRVSYDENTDSIHLTSKDKDIPTTNGFHLALNSGKDAEYALRTLLEQRGMIPEERFKSIPTALPYPDSRPDNYWDRFPLGVHANGKEAIWDSSTSPNAIIIGTTGAGKSVIQRNILLHCFQNSEQWKILGIGLLRVEFAPYKQLYPEMVDIATSVTEGVEILQYAYGEMMLRYAEMEKTGVNNFRDMTEPPKSFMIMVDEFMHFLSPVENTLLQAHLDENALKAEAVQLLTDIARLGRAAGINLVLTSQRLDEEVLGGELIHNCQTRIAAGALSPEQSKALLGNKQATRLNAAIRGRGYLQQQSKGADFQSYYAPIDRFKKLNS